MLRTMPQSCPQSCPQVQWMLLIPFEVSTLDNAQVGECTIVGLCSFRAATQRLQSAECLGKMATPEKYTSCRPSFCSSHVLLEAFTSHVKACMHS